MSQETEHPLTNDNEIRYLCESEEYLQSEIESYPKGSCNYQIAKIHLKQVKERLEELGIDNINEEESDIEEDEYCLRRSLPR